MITPAMASSVELHYPFLQSVSIFLPCHLVHPRRRPPFQVEIAATEQIDIDMVQQGGEPHLWVSLGCFTYTVQPACPDPPARCPARDRLFRVLLGQRPRYGQAFPPQSP